MRIARPERLPSPAKIATLTGLPIHLFGDREEHDRKRIPFLSRVGKVRYAIDEIVRGDTANSVPDVGPKSVVSAADVTTEEVYRKRRIESHADPRLSANSPENGSIPHRILN
jgi:hypothetical protein